MSVNNMRKNKWIYALFFLGLIILVYPHIAQVVNKHIQKSQVNHFIKEAKSMPSIEITNYYDQVRKCNEAIFKNEEGFHDPFTEYYKQNAYPECQDITFDGGQFAAIEIPKLDLHIPIYLGATENELSRGIGQVEGSSLPVGGISTHTVLAGHRGMGTKAMFRNLDLLKIGDVFYIHTLEGILTYEVYDVEVILPHETDNLRIVEGKDLASLITCHPYRANSHRLVVHGERLN